MLGKSNLRICNDNVRLRSIQALSIPVLVSKTSEIDKTTTHGSYEIQNSPSVLDPTRSEPEIDWSTMTDKGFDID